MRTTIDPTMRSGDLCPRDRRRGYHEIVRAGGMRIETRGSGRGSPVIEDAGKRRGPRPGGPCSGAYFTTSTLLRLSEIAIAAISSAPRATWLQDGGTPAIVSPFRTTVRVNAPMMVLMTLP